MTGLLWIQSERRIVPADHPVLPLQTPGVLFGESVFETLRARKGRLFRLEAHLARLRRGLARLRWKVHVNEELVKQGLALVLREELAQGDARVRITVLRTGEPGGAEILVLATPYTPMTGAYEHGVSAAVTRVRLDEEAPWTTVKSGNRLSYQQAKMEAEQAGAWEGLLLNTKGELADGSITSVHMVIGQSIRTPHTSCGALPGITRSVIQEIAADATIPYQAGVCTPSQLYRASEAFLTNAVIGVVPLVRVDGQRISDGLPGPITQQMAAAYNERVARESAPVSG